MSNEAAKISKNDKDAGYFTEDSLENLVANLGTEQDKRHASRFVNSKQLSRDGQQQELNALYRTDWLAGKVVDIVPNDMTREWRTFKGEIEPEVVTQLIEEEERLGLAKAFNTAHKWARLYGTAFILLAVDDSLDPAEPLIVDRLKPKQLRHIKVLDRHRLNREGEVQLNPLKPGFGLPEKYRLNETPVVVHHTRLLRFDAIQLPYDEFRRNNFWSDSVLDRLYEAITNLNTVTSGASSMVYETNVDIIKVKGLMTYLQTAEGEKLIRKRFGLAAALKSFNNMMLLDTEEEYQSKKNTFAGLPDLIDRFSQQLSAASDIPATRLLGSSASGLNATGEGDLKNYYDMVRSGQQDIYKPHLDYFDTIMAKSLGIGDDADLSYEFDPLFQMTPKQIAELEFQNAQRDQIYLDRDVVTEVIVAKDLQQEGVYTNIDEAHIKELEETDFGFTPDPNLFGPEEEEEESGGGEGTEESGDPIPEGTNEANDKPEA